jgi:hypothetical protein
VSRSALPGLQREVEALRARAERFRDPVLHFQLGRAFEAIVNLGATYRRAREMVVASQLAAREELRVLVEQVQERESRAAQQVPPLRALPSARGGGGGDEKGDRVRCSPRAEIAPADRRSA